MPLPQISSFWHGSPLGPSAAACLSSFARHGHPVVLYSYSPMSLPPGISGGDASTVMPWERLAAFLEAKAYALASDLFRYAMLSQELGVWVDTDCYCVRPIEDAPSIFGAESGGLNTAVLKLPPRSALLQDLRSIEQGFVPPWLPWWKRANRRLRGWVGKPKKLQDMEWGTTGPRSMDYFARKHGVENLARARAVFYPVDWSEVRKLCDPMLRIEDLIQPQTLVVHLYNDMHRQLRLGAPPPSSPMGRIIREGEAAMSSASCSDAAS